MLQQEMSRLQQEMNMLQQEMHQMRMDFVKLGSRYYELNQHNTGALSLIEKLKALLKEEKGKSDSWKKDAVEKQDKNLNLQREINQLHSKVYAWKVLVTITTLCHFLFRWRNFILASLELLMVENDNRKESNVIMKVSFHNSMVSLTEVTKNLVS